MTLSNWIEHNRPTAPKFESKDHQFIIWYEAGWTEPWILEQETGPCFESRGSYRTLKDAMDRAAVLRARSSFRRIS